VICRVGQVATSRGCPAWKGIGQGDRYLMPPLQCPPHNYQRICNAPQLLLCGHGGVLGCADHATALIKMQQHKNAANVKRFHTDCAVVATKALLKEAMLQMCWLRHGVRRTRRTPRHSPPWLTKKLSGSRPPCRPASV
jgi:hypothetical protein